MNCWISANHINESVETLLHEFGHGLQHMLTRVDEGLVSGIRGVEWDAVELPSQFMENWCYHEPALCGLSGHVETGEPLPRALFDKIRAARTFRALQDGAALLALLAAALVLDPTVDGYKDRLTDAYGLASYAATLGPASALNQSARVFVGASAGGARQPLRQSRRASSCARARRRCSCTRLP